MPAISLADAVGVLGAVLILATYFLLQAGRLDAGSMTYSVANALGAGGIIVSLIYDFNLSAFIIESFWLAISLYGIYRSIRRRNAF